jgi:hypothetical protein
MAPDDGHENAAGRLTGGVDSRHDRVQALVLSITETMLPDGSRNQAMLGP